MSEKLVDIVKNEHRVLHTFPVSIEAPSVEVAESEFERKAIDAAAFARLVPPEEFKELTPRLHVSRGGPVKAYGDDLDLSIETKPSLEQGVREHAYRLWESDGRPEGKADEYWYRAHEQHLRERAYVLWCQEGRPEGRADEYWLRTVEFERG